jgi:hypothetical protein
MSFLPTLLIKNYTKSDRTGQNILSSPFLSDCFENNTLISCFNICNLLNNCYNNVRSLSLYGNQFIHYSHLQEEIKNGKKNENHGW